MRKKQQAFTLIELMVTMIVMAVLIAVAIPSFNEQLRSNRSLAIGEDLANALNFARAEAIKRNGRVSICASNTGTSCEGSWEEGWLVFVDSAVSDFSAAPVLANVADILRVSDFIDPDAVISEVNQKTFIRYTGTGMLARLDDNAVTITAGIENCTNNSARRISVGLSGSVNVSRAPCAAE